MIKSSEERYYLLAKNGARSLFDLEHYRLLDCNRYNEITHGDEESYFLINFKEYGQDYYELTVDESYKYLSWFYGGGCKEYLYDTIYSDIDILESQQECLRESCMYESEEEFNNKNPLMVSCKETYNHLSSILGGHELNIKNEYKIVNVGTNEKDENSYEAIFLIDLKNEKYYEISYKKAYEILDWHKHIQEREYVLDDKIYTKENMLSWMIEDIQNMIKRCEIEFNIRNSIMEEYDM